MTEALHPHGVARASTTRPVGVDATGPKRVLLQFRVVAHAMRSPSSHTRPHRYLTDRKLMVLSAIARAPGMTVSGVATCLGVRQPTASQVIKSLAALRLVRVQVDARDRRAVRIHASADGLTALRKLPAHFDFGDRLPKALGQLDAAALASLESGLAKLLQALLLSQQQHRAHSTVAPPLPAGP